jgi:hypothetical protein
MNGMSGQGERVTQMNQQIPHGLAMDNKNEWIDNGVMAIHKSMGLIEQAMML